MMLSADDRLPTFAKEAAKRHYQRSHPAAPETDAMHFALRSWRWPEFIQAAAEILATWQALDEAAAACN